MLPLNIHALKNKHQNKEILKVTIIKIRNGFGNIFFLQPSVVPLIIKSGMKLQQSKVLRVELVSRGYG